MTTYRDCPRAWTAARDEAFFRIVQDLFCPAWLEAASALLAGYDPVAEPVPAARG